jgi:hypothetical protein
MAHHFWGAVKAEDTTPGGVKLLPVDIIAVIAVVHLKVPIQQIQCIAERGIESVIVVIVVIVIVVVVVIVVN